MRKWLFFWVILATAPALAADPPPGAAEAQAEARARQLTAVCLQVACRRASRTITLHLADGGTYDLRTNPYPYFDPSGVVVLYPGETITLGFTRTGDVLDKPVLVSVRDPGGVVNIGAGPAPVMTLSFALAQDEKKPDTILTVTSTVGAMLKYDARITAIVPGGVRSAASNTCPLMPPQGRAPSFTGFEHWPQPVGMMVISNIRALPPGAPMAC